MTIMSTTGGGCNVPRINRFSNPHVNYALRPTGSAAEDNARTIRDNVVRFVKSNPHVLSWCEELNNWPTLADSKYRVLQR